MKKSALLAAALFALAISANAQGDAASEKSPPTKAYLRIGAGYGFTHAGNTEILSSSNTTIVFNATDNLDANGNESTTLKRGSFGTGVSTVLAGGYYIDRHFAVELGVQLIAAPTNYKSTFSSSSTSGGTDVISLSTKAKLPVYIIPALVYTVGNFYGRAGIVLPVSDKIIIKDDETHTFSASAHAEYTLTHRFGIGFQGALGVSFPVAAHISLWGEVNGISRGAFAKKLEVTALTVAGVDELSTLTTNEKVTEFSYSVSTTSAQADPNVADKAITSSSPFSSIGFSVGVMFKF